MKYISTRGEAPHLSFSEALSAGLASDGGLYVPEKFPSFHDSLQTLMADLPQSSSDAFSILSFQQFAKKTLKPFVQNDLLEKHLDTIIEKSFFFPLPLKALKKGVSVLELFHGPTCAFKDVGAQFLAQALSCIPCEKTRLVLAATSGDTGGAVAAAFWKKPGFAVAILYPEGRIAQRQEQQLTCWGENIKAFSVKGTFDDCQFMVKDLFKNRSSSLNPKNSSQQESLANKDIELQSLLKQFLQKYQPTSANSINLGRLLPQMLYYAYSSLLHFKFTKKTSGFIIPSGNLGHAVACAWAIELGFPIHHIVLAHNANRTIVDYFSSEGVYKAQPTQATLANAMDVGNPSNAERLFHLKSFSELKKIVTAVSVSDRQIQTQIQTGLSSWEQVWCPHTACAVQAYSEVDPSQNWILVATAHPAKFDTVVEPLIGTNVPIPQNLKDLLDKPSHKTNISTHLKELLYHLQ